MTKTKSTNKTLKVTTSAVLLASSFSTIVAPMSASASFPDIAGNSHEKDILQLLERKIIQGYPDGTFKPETSITRGQAAKIIASVLNLDTTNITNPGFSDVDEKHAFYPYIAALAKLNIISGYEDGTFKQDATITRGQMAKMIALGFNLTSDSDEQHPFTDVAEGSIYAPYIKALYKHEVTKGTTDTTFSPRNSVSRGQLASFVIRAENATKAPVADSVEGTIEEVLANGIVIDGKTIAVPADFAKVLAANRQALEGAKIALNTKGGEATNIDTLELATDATSFDGNGITISTLSIPASVETLTNVTAETIHYHVTDQPLTANNVKASDFYLNNEKIFLASIANVGLPSNVANITFNGSTIENIHSNVDEVTISKTNATIKNISATHTQQLTLNGDFSNITISPNTNIGGTAKIETLVFEQQPSKYSVGAGISVSKVKYAGQTYTWNDFVAKFPTQQEGTSETTPEDSATVKPGQNDSTGGTSNGSGATGGSTTGGSSSSNGGSNTGGGYTDGNGNNNSENTDDKENPPVIEKPLIIIDENNNTVTVNNESFDVTDAQKQFLAEQKESIKDITLATNENEETIIENISINTNNFDGTDLSSIGIKNLIITAQNITNIFDIETVTVNNSQSTSLSNIVADKIVANGAIKEIKNTTANVITVQSTEQSVIVNATATTLDLQNTSADVVVRGNIENIVGGENNTLTIATSTPTVNVNNVNANEIVIEEALPVVIASLSLMRSFATPTTSAMTVKFAGDYSNKILTVKRSDSIVDVQSTTPFSRVTVAGNGTLLNSSTLLANVNVDANVTKFTLNADVEEFTLDLASPIEIMSEAANIVIEKLSVTKKVANTDGYISLLNVSVGNTIVNDNSDPTLLFKQAVTNDTFTSSLSAQTYPNFGKVKLVLPSGISGTISVLQVPVGQNPVTYTNVTSVPTEAKEYSNSFFLEANTEHVVVYANDNGTIKESIINTSNIPKFLVIPSYNSGNLMVFTRYDVTKSLDETMDYLYIFDEGKLVYENNDFAGITQTTDSNGQRTFTLNTGIKTLNGSFESIVSEGGIYHYSSPENASTYFAPILKELAKKAHADGKPEMIKSLLAEMSSLNAATFDSLFLKEYVKELATNPDDYTTTKDILDLIDELTPEYQVNIQLTAADLYLNSIPAASSATYSKPGIVEVAVSESEGKLMLNPLATGTTTVRVEDKDGLATLINVEVTEENGKPVIADGNYEIIAKLATAGELLDGTNNFRFFTNNDGTHIIPTKLENSFALVKLSNSTFNGFAQTKVGNVYELSEKRDINPKEILLADLGLTSLTNPNSTNIGFLQNDDKDGYLLYPRAAVSANEILTVTDGTSTTAINVTSSVTEVTATIAKSPNKISIADDLHLDAITNKTMYPQGSLDIHYTNDGNDIQFFANKAAKVSYVLADSGDRKTIVNVDSTLTNGQLSVADGDIVKKDITTYDNNTANDTSDDVDNTGATVTNISGTSVRAHNLEIFATQTGTSIVTLSNGNQYQFDVKQTGNQFTIDVEELSNVIIEATTLHMTNIKEATSSNDSDRLQVVDGKLVVNLAADGTSKITVKSATEPAETTVLYVTKTGNNYTFDPATDIVRTVLDASILGLDSVTDVFGDPSPTARIKLGTDGKVYVYGFAEGTRSFRVNDGTNNSAINVTVATNTTTSKLEVNAGAVKYPTVLTASGTISSTAARIKDSVVYATGLGLDTNGQATIEVPIAHNDPTVQAFESIVLTQHPDTKLLSFGTATTTFKKSINKADFDFSTLYSSTVSSISGNGISAAVNGDQLTITAIADSEARVQVNESTAADKKAFVYVKRDGDNFNAIVEKSTATALSDYGYTTTPAALTAPFTKDGIVRAHIDENLNVDFYALAAGKTAYKVENGNGKNLFINVEVVDGAPRTTNVEVVKVDATTLNGEATIIEGDAFRLSANKTELYANKLGTKSIVKRADGTFAEYEVIENSNGQYEIDVTELAKSATISKTQLGLDGTLQVSGLDGAIASYSVTDDGIIVYGNNNGTASMTVSNGTKSVVVNVTVDDNGVTISAPIAATMTTAPTLIDPSDANIVRIDGTTVYALAAGTAEVLVGNEVQQIIVTKGTNNQYEISAPVTISEAVYSATDLGFDANAAMTIETGYNTTDFVVTNVNGKIVAYSKLATGATGTTEVIINASGERTLVNLADTGADLITSRIAKQPALIDTAAVIADTTVARQKAGTVYALKEGNTHATVTHATQTDLKYIQSVDVTRSSNGVLEAVIKDVKLDDSAGGVYSTLTETDTTLIGIVNGDVYAKKTSGKTTVQKTVTEGTGADAVEVTKVYEITITNTNGKIEISEKLISSKTLLATDAQLANITSAEVLYGTNPDAVTLSILDKENTKKGIAIYSNATAAQSLAILVTDSAGHKAVIDVTIDETGTITNAVYVKQTTTVDFSATNEIVQEENARGVWNGTTLTTYAIGEGNAALKFANGLVNVTTTKAATNKVSMTSSVLKHTGFTNQLNNITNGDILKSTATGFYPTATGSALVHTDNKVYSVYVTLENGLYKLVVSNGVPFTTLAIGETDTYNIFGSTLNGVSIAIDEDANDNSVKDDKQLIIYKEGAAVGTSDLLITSGGLNTIYHVKTDGITIDMPKEATDTIAADMTGTIIIGDSIRLNGTDIYYLAEKASTIKSDTNGRLVTIDVKRNINGYFTATPEYVSGTVTEAPAALTNYEIDGTTIYAKSTDTANATESALITDSTDASGVKAFYTTFSTTRTGDKFAVEIDERKAYQYNPTTDFGLSSTYTVANFEGPNVATVKTIGTKLAIIAGDATGDATITIKDNTGKQLILKVNRQADGTFIVTPQASLNNLLFSEMELDGTANAITAEGFDPTIINVTATTEGLNITAIKEGTTSLQLKQNGAVVGLVNVTIAKALNGSLQITSTPVTYKATDDELYAESTARKVTDVYYPTAVGKTLYKTATGAQFVIVTQNTTTKLYEVSNTTHTLAEFTATNLGLTTINSAAAATAAVGTLPSTDRSKLYVYGQNDGTTDIVVSDGTNNTVIVAMNGATLTTEVARTEITDSTLAAAEWTSNAPTVATVRDGYMYTQEPGAALLQATIGGRTVFMNAVVIRNSNGTFNIQPEVVSATKNTWSTVEILSGSDIVAIDGTTLYAQQVGTATVKIKDTSNVTKVYTVTVSENTNGTMKIEVGQPMTHHEFTAQQLGLDSITKAVVQSINGAGVVTAQVQNGVLVVLAKASGQAQISVNEGKTFIHMLVDDVNGELTMTPTIAETTIAGATTITKSKGEENIVRFNGEKIYALNEGKIVADVDRELYNVSVETKNNKLTPTASRIEYQFNNAQSVTVADASDNIVKATGDKIIATGYGSKTVIVDSQTYKVTVNEDGSLDVVLFAAGQFDFAQSALAQQFTDLTNATITSQSSLVTSSVTGTTIALTPKDSVNANATDIITVENGSTTVQLKATIEAVANGFAVTSVELVSKTLNASDLNNIYAATILNTGGTAFNSSIGLMRTENGILTVYPGAAGEEHFIVRDGEGNQSLFALISTPTNSAQSFEVKPVSLTLPYDQFQYVPTVLATKGKAKATNVGQDLNIHFADTTETVFVTTSGQNLYHTVLTKPKVSTVDPNKFDVSEYVIQAITPITGDITNVTPGLHAISHNGKTLLYANADTPTTAYFTDPNGIINKVTVGADYALEIKKVYAENDVTYTSLQLMQGADVVALEGNKLAAKKTGTGIYKTDTNDYVEINVTGSETTGYTVTPKDLDKKDLSDLGTDVKVLAPTSGIYADGTVVYGLTTEKIAVSVNDAIYTTTMTDGLFNAFNRLELDLTTALGWSTFASHTLVNDSQFGTITGTTFIPKSVNTNGETITFTTAMGIKKQLKIIVKDDFTIEYEAGLDEIGYQFSTSNASIQFTFDVNVDAIPDDLQFIVDAGGTVFPSKAPLFIWTGTNTNYEGTFTLNIPEYDQTAIPLGKSFTISATKDGEEWQLPVITSNELKFLHIVR